MLSHRWRSLVIVLACLLPVPSFAQTNTVAADTSAQPSFSLEPGDVLRVNVWREPTLTGDFQVDEQGRLTLPMLGTMMVLNRPWYALRDTLLVEYGRQLRNPSVIITPLRRVQVLGEVGRPGQYLADPTLSLAGLVALAGGATPQGDLRRVRVVRNGQTIIKSASIETLVLESGVRSNDQIFVGKRPWLERNGAFLASAIISTTSILITLIQK
jgi:polysaccharide export outer membrane protein